MSLVAYPACPSNVVFMMLGTMDLPGWIGGLFIGTAPRSTSTDLPEHKFHLAVLFRDEPGLNAVWEREILPISADRLYNISQLSDLDSIYAGQMFAYWAMV